MLGPLTPLGAYIQPPDPRRDWLPPIIYKLPALTKENKNPAPVYKIWNKSIKKCGLQSAHKKAIKIWQLTL